MTFIKSCACSTSKPLSTHVRQFDAMTDCRIEPWTHDGSSTKACQQALSNCTTAATLDPTTVLCPGEPHLQRQCRRISKVSDNCQAFQAWIWKNQTALHPPGSQKVLEGLYSLGQHLPVADLNASPHCLHLGSSSPCPGCVAASPSIDPLIQTGLLVAQCPHHHCHHHCRQSLGSDCRHLHSHLHSGYLQNKGFEIFESREQT